MATSFIPVRSGDLLSAQSAKALHRLITTQSSLQLVAAADTVGDVLVTLGMNPLVGVVSLEVGLEAAMGTGEIVVYSVLKLNTDRTTLTTVATVTINDTSTPGPINALGDLVAGVSFVAGDIVYVTRAYTAGSGANTPINSITIQFE